MFSNQGQMLGYTLAKENIITLEPRGGFDQIMKKIDDYREIRINND